MDVYSLSTIFILLTATRFHETYSKELPSSTAKARNTHTDPLHKKNDYILSMFSPCGRPPPVKESRCQPFSKEQYPHCASFPGKPANVRVYQSIQQHAKPEIIVEWEPPSTGFTDLWGFQVNLIDKTFTHPMTTSQCKQINKKQKSKLLVRFKGLMFGGHYEIRVQSMPPNGNESTVYHHVYIKEKCDIPELHSTKLCCQFSSISSYINECRIHEKPIVSINVTWHLTCNSVKQFKLKWNTSNPVCGGIADVKENNTYTIWLPQICSDEQHNFTGEIYGVSMEQKTTNTERFWFTVDLNPSSAPSLVPTLRPESSNIAIITTVVSIGAILGMILVVLLFVFFKHRASPVIRINDHSQPLTETSGTDQILSDPVRVLILYASCCTPCKKVVYSLWDALDSTNLFDVRLDMLSEPKLNENPLRWYETQVKEATRILLVTSRLMLMADLNPASANKPRDSCDYVSIWYQLNLLRGEVSNTADFSKFVPVYTNYNGNKHDIPRFLSMCRNYKLPNELDKVMFHLLGMNTIRKHSKRPIVQISSDSHPFNAKKDELLKAIADAEHVHRHANSHPASTQLNPVV